MMMIVLLVPSNGASYKVIEDFKKSHPRIDFDLKTTDDVQMEDANTGLKGMILLFISNL
jgi:hypothetical protein